VVVFISFSVLSMFYLHIAYDLKYVRAVCFQWSEDDEKFIVEDKKSEFDDINYNKLIPPPVVKFSW